MSLENSIHALLAGLETSDREDWRRKAARVGWVKETAAAWREAQKRMDERCDAAVGRLSKEEFGRLCDEEEAKIDAFRASLKAAAERDVWPRELYWAGV
jgi:hypothetical protein